ncbi:hypothetical protein Tco_0500643 [Tanacetum coccineum]
MGPPSNVANSLGVTSEARANPQLSSRNDASAASTTKADLRNSAPSTDPHVLVEQTKSVSEWLETVLTQPITWKRAKACCSLPVELYDLPSKFDELTEEVKGLKKQVHELEIELPGDLKEIPTKLEDFTKTITSLTSQVASFQDKLKTLDALPDQSVPLVGQADTISAEGEKNTNQATIS